jgi:alcohol dehydrogenase class IV
LIRLKSLDGQRALVVTGGDSVVRSGALGKVMDYLTSAGFAVHHLSGVQPEPLEEEVTDRLPEVRQFQPDWLVALGGGSVLDVAKLLWALYEHPDLDLERLRTPFSLPPLRQKARLAAIPTTSGTGAEVSSTAVVREAATGRKVPLVSHELIPDLAILDPLLTVSLPPALTAAAGMDALTHAVEGYVSLLHNPFTDALAVDVVRTILHDLPRAVAGGDDLEARERLHYAAGMAGLVQNNVSVGITHSLAHQMGVFGLSHGVSNSLFLTPVMRFNRAECPRYDQLAPLVGRRDAGDLIDAIEALRAEIGLPLTLREAGVPPFLGEDRDSPISLKEMAARALADPCTRANPRRPKEEDLADLIRSQF